MNIDPSDGDTSRQSGSSSSSSFMTSSSSDGGLTISSAATSREEGPSRRIGSDAPAPQSGPAERGRSNSEGFISGYFGAASGEHDSPYPPYILLDEEKYEDLVEAIKTRSNLTLPSTLGTASRNPSRPASPHRQGRIEDLLSRIDALVNDLSGNNQMLLAQKSEPLHPLAQIQKHKHLVELVQRRIAQDCSEEERRMIFGLVSSVDQSHSKWAHPGRLGQAELYGSLEKVLNELKAFTPYSIPFSTRVSRKDVPDYYDIIKKPMDLGTMMRKLKGFIYNTKREFQADLQRIYNNCFTYNTDPNSPLRLHVSLLKDKWTRLMAEVPDIEVRAVAIASPGLSPNESLQTLTSMASESSSRIPIVLDDEYAEDVEELSSSTGIPSAENLLLSLPSLPPRSSLKMGLYHKARLKEGRKQQKRKVLDMLYPELVYPNQHFPEPFTVTMQPKRIHDEDSGQFEAFVGNFELWRRFRLEAAHPVEGEQEDVQMLEPVRVQRPLFETDSRYVIERNTSALLGLLLTNIGFEAVRSDALTLLRDTFVAHVEGLIRGVLRRYTQGHEPALVSVKHTLFPRDPPTEMARLQLYQASFIPGRQARIEEAMRRIGEWRAEQWERLYNMSMAEVNIVDCQELGDEDDANDDGDLDSVTLEDEEELLVLDPSMRPTGEASLDIFGLAPLTTAPPAQMNESVLTQELLALPKRSLNVSGSGIEGSLDPIQFIGEPVLKRLDDD